MHVDQHPRAGACLLVLTLLLLSPTVAAQRQGLQSRDLSKLKAVGEVQLSPDAAKVAYTVTLRDRAGTARSEVWIMDFRTNDAVRLSLEGETASAPRWSPDAQWIAYMGRNGNLPALCLSRPNGRDRTVLAAVSSTNHPLPSAGERFAWSPDGTGLAFISATTGPDTEEVGGDPVVIRRYLYKPPSSAGASFNDNRRLHIFIVDIASKKVRQLTDGDYYEHSIGWSPAGDEIVFLSNREPDPDRVFNYDIFAVKVVDRDIRRLTDTRNAEYRPVWSPDGKSIAYLGTMRERTSSETTMEDTHVWLIDADGTNRRELGKIDNRQSAPAWAPDGRAVYTTVQERGSTRLYRLPLDGGSPTVVVPSPDARGRIASWAVGSGAVIAYTLETPEAPAELYVKIGAPPPKALTSQNAALLGARQIAQVESLTFKSADGLEVEAFLTKPVGMTASSTHPMVVVIKGGPHGQQGPAFHPAAQAYAAHGYAVLMVNYRGSTGYGQKFADAIFGDQNGGEARDVLAGVDAALRKYPWIDPERLGVEGRSYGGQLTNWLITQTDRFKAAIPTASISNLVSFNYMSYYHDYLSVEFGLYPHETWKAGQRPTEAGAAMHLMDFLWARSPLRYVSRVRTPTMFIHGENDNNVPIAEAEQYYIALRDVGVETVMVRYPREGHGITETQHQIDIIDRSIAWYERHFLSSRRTK